MFYLTLPPFFFILLSIGPNKTLQADVYRSLRMPIILVGDARLGGISATVCAYESLRIRGYTVHAILMIDRDHNAAGNFDLLEEYFERTYRNIPGDKDDNGHRQWSLGYPPKIFRLSAIPEDKATLLHTWFHTNEEPFLNVFDHVNESVSKEWKSYVEMTQAGSKYIWWPFTQHGLLNMEKDVNFIESAHGDHYRFFSMVKPSTEAMKDEVSSEETTSSSGNGNDIISAKSGRPVLTTSFDASASWWTQAVGHGHSSMSVAIAEACGRYGHVIFPRNLHPPVVQLSRYMIEKGPGKDWAQRIFYSDNGSTAMEIAMKLAFRLSEHRNTTSRPSNPEEKKKKIGVISQMDGYHGDTLGTMNTASPSAFNKLQHPWYECQALVLSTPFIGFANGRLRIDISPLQEEKVGMALSEDNIRTAQSISQLLDVTQRMDGPLAQAYRAQIQAKLDASSYELGALIIEPMMLGAGGLKFIDPLYQKVLIQECRARKIPVVFDEVAVGMYRLGPVSTTSLLKEYPDIACYGKMISGGYLPISVTLTNEETFQSFVGDSNSQALMHGHSYTANPVACSAALEAIRLLENCKELNQETGFMRDSFPAEEVKLISKLPGVVNAMSLGSVMSIELAASTSILSSNTSVPNHLPSTPPSPSTPTISLTAVVISLLHKERVYARPLGNTIYLMATPYTSDFDKQRLLLKL
ncbi:aminotransferase class III-fold pyridoxal phosphate-dependent enzyme, partial [Patescibacteria group bacterium]|nr:aminotransferase class III-fold pyridoxal phosphate-dependent enzyme [Patescibacteria group bacterium]